MEKTIKIKMNILWITNILLPDAATYLSKEELVVGGWMVGLLDSLKFEKNLKFGVASVYKGDDFISFEKEGVSYFLIPLKGNSTVYNSRIETYWKKINLKFRPDIVHVHGTEHAHGLAMINSCPDVKYVISIQGLVSVIPKYFYAGISKKNIFLNITFKDIFKGTLFRDKKDYKRRGVIEREYIRKVENIIGRTDWDRDHSYFINKKRNYFFCNESLRSVFYLKKYDWNLENIERNSILISQAGNPLKGLHIVLKAVSLIKDEFPNIKIYVGGNNITQNKDLKSKIKRGGYGKYILKLISDLKLTNQICFKGPLNEVEMAQRYQKSHVFICPSSIENSPNSLGEAQILGVPSIASFVGGTPNMVTHGVSGLLYRFEEIEMLASAIRKIFNDDNLALKISLNGQKEAELRHNKQINKENMIKIYNKLINS